MPVEKKIPETHNSSVNVLDAAGKTNFIKPKLLGIHLYYYYCQTGCGLARAKESMPKMGYGHVTIFSPTFLHPLRT